MAELECVLKPQTIYRLHHMIDRDGVFAKEYTRYVDGALTVVGLRIGEKPGHIVAYFGDTVIRDADGTYSVRAAGGDR